MRLPTTRYAMAGDVNIAYQVVGDGPIDVVWLWGLASSIETAWEDPSYAAFLRRLAEFSRLILYDRRGCGASDRGGNTATATLEERTDDLLAVLEAVGSETACLLGVSEGGALATLFAATHPERVSRIVLYGTNARFVRDDAHPWGWHEIDSLTDLIEFMRSSWGELDGAPIALALWAPSMLDDAPFAEWLAKHSRQSVSRGELVPLVRALEAYDLFDVFAAVRVPTLVLHRRDDALVPVSHGHWLAEHIPGATYVELLGNDHLPFVGDADGVLVEIETFLTGTRPVPTSERRLLTVVFTNLVDSSRPRRGLGDDAWREQLSAHDEMTRNHLARFGGTEVKHLGDGFFATFDGPARAIHCGLGLLDGTGRLGLELRVAVHTGECDIDGDDVRGAAVQVSSGLVEHALPGEILVSGTVRDLVAGSGIRFGEARELELGGTNGARTVLPVLTWGEDPQAVRRLIVEQANSFRRDGEYWTVAYDGRVVSLRDSKGLRDLARLLQSPGVELHVLDLATEGIPRAGRSVAAAAREAGLSAVPRRGDVVIDTGARDAFRARLAELEAAIDDADEHGDGEASAAARIERDALVDELAAAYGLRGRARRAPDDVERARKAVTRRLRDALSRIERAHTPLGRHLNASIHTGALCSYQPEREVSWTVITG